MSKQPPPAHTASAVGPCPTKIQIVGRPGTGSLPRTIAPLADPFFYIKLVDSMSETCWQTVLSDHDLTINNCHQTYMYWRFPVVKKKERDILWSLLNILLETFVNFIFNCMYCRSGQVRGTPDFGS